MTEPAFDPPPPARPASALDDALARYDAARAALARSRRGPDSRIDPAPPPAPEDDGTGTDFPATREVELDAPTWPAHPAPAGPAPAPMSRQPISLHDAVVASRAPRHPGPEAGRAAPSRARAPTVPRAAVPRTIDPLPDGRRRGRLAVGIAAGAALLAGVAVVADRQGLATPSVPIAAATPAGDAIDLAARQPTAAGIGPASPAASPPAPASAPVAGGTTPATGAAVVTEAPAPTSAMTGTHAAPVAPPEAPPARAPVASQPPRPHPGTPRDTGPSPKVAAAIDAAQARADDFLRAAAPASADAASGGTP